MWRIRVGDLLTRAEISHEYGGGTQGGIQPSRRTPNVFLFSDPIKSVENGYDYDGWNHDLSEYSYTGEGRIGNQVLSRGNGAVQQHVSDGRALRLFHSVGYVTETSTRLHEYVGAFEIDVRRPYEFRRGLDIQGQERDVVVFRLRPV